MELAEFDGAGRGLRAWPVVVADRVAAQRARSLWRGACGGAARLRARGRYGVRLGAGPGERTLRSRRTPRLSPHRTQPPDKKLSGERPPSGRSGQNAPAGDDNYPPDPTP